MTLEGGRQEPGSKIGETAHGQQQQAGCMMRMWAQGGSDAALLDWRSAGLPQPGANPAQGLV